VDVVEAALQSLGRIPDRQAAQLLVQAGTAMYEHGQVTAAYGQYAQALTRAERSAMPDRATKAHSGLLLCCTETGDFEAALQHLAAAYNLLDRNPGKDSASLRGQLHLNETWLRSYQGTREEARNCLNRARRAARKAGDDGLLAWTYCAEATLHIDDGNYRDALDCAEQAVDRAGDRNDIRLLREAKNRCTIAHLCLDQPDAALSDATFAASIVQRHGALATYTLKGLAALRCGEDEAARSTFDRAYRLATDYVTIEGNTFEVWDLIGLVTCAIGLDDRRSYEHKMVEAFRRARSITTASGAVGRVLLLIDQLALVSTSPLITVARTVATG
jgi:tetratricopeptide (TPR) repeat protein